MIRLMRGALLCTFFCAFSIFVCVQAQAFTVGTQNLYHYTTRLSERKTHMDAEFRQPGVPQIMGFQEAARWTGREMLYDYFVRLTGYTGIYQATNHFGVMNDGVALVSSLAASNLISRPLPHSEAFSKQAFNAGLFEVENQRQVLVINAHLSHGEKNKDRRVFQTKALLDFCAAYANFPIVIVGDLNGRYDSDAIKVLRDAGFIDVMDGRGATYDPTTNPLVTDKKFGPSRLDYILYQPTKLQLVSARLMFKENWVSDHYGLRAEFQ